MACGWRRGATRATVALAKATLDDKARPKEKHVRTLAQLAIDPDEAAQVGAELLQRLHSCRQPQAANVAAKVLFVAHRLMLAGASKCLRDAGVEQELELVCGDGATPHYSPQADTCKQAAAYLQSLCKSALAAALRGRASVEYCREWRSAQPDKLFSFLPTLQPLVGLALESAACDFSVNEALHALQLSLVEDAFALVRLEGFVISRLQAFLFQLQPANGAPNVAIDAIQTFLGHSRSALKLQAVLDRERSSSAQLDAFLQRAVLWGGAQQQASEDAMDEDTLPVLGTCTSATHEWVYAESTAALQDRDALARQLLSLLPPATLAGLTDRALGRPLQSMDELAMDDIRSIPAKQIIQAARQIKTHHSSAYSPEGVSTRIAVGVSREPLLSLPELESPQGGECRTFGALTVPALTSRVPATISSSSTGAGIPPLSSSILDVPPLPIAMGAVFPSLQHEMKAEVLRLAAYECLLLAVKVPSAVIDDIHLIRTRLGISLKQHKAMASLLRLPDPDSSSILRDLARSGSLPSSGSPAYRALLLIFLRTQTVEDLVELSSPIGKPARAHVHDQSQERAFLERQLSLLRNVSSDGSAAASRLRAHVERLMLLRAAPLPRSESGHSVLQEEEALRTTLAKFGVVRPGEIDGLAKHWPEDLGYRLYCTLLEAIFDVDEPTQEAHDSVDVEKVLKCTRISLCIDTPQHDLAKLSVFFDHYQHSGQASLLPKIDKALTTSLLSSAASGGTPFLASYRSEVLAGMVSFLSSKLKDFFVHYACDVDEMWASVNLWRRCLLALTTAQRTSDVDEIELEEQARRLIESSVSRHVARLRGAVQLSLREQGPSVDDAEALILLGSRLYEEFEYEPFSSAFDKCTKGQRPNEHGSGAMLALPVLEREILLGIQSVISCFQTLSKTSIAVVAAITPIQQLLQRGGLKEPLAQLGQLCERMVDGWCTQLHEQLDQSLIRMLRSETWEPLTVTSQGASMAIPSSAVDVFVELDRLVKVYIRVAKLQPLPKATHQRVTSLVGSQTAEYVKRLVAGCVQRPPSRLEVQKGNAAGKLKGHPQAVPRSAALESQTLMQLLLRLNACEWAGEQFLVLMNSLNGELQEDIEFSGVAETTRLCEAACNDMLEYIQAKSRAHTIET